MKKIILMSLICCMTAVANAKILRVNNTAGSSAPYTSFSDAYAVAEDGDTILFDGSTTSYGDIVLDKKLAILGHGYMLEANNVSELNECGAFFGNISIETEGCVVQGVEASNIRIRANNIVVTRCYAGSIGNGGGFTGYYSGVFSGVVIHQNFVLYKISGMYTSTGQHFTNSQITNNIVVTGNYGESLIDGIENSVIEYNTIINKSYLNEVNTAHAIKAEASMVKNNLIFSTNSLEGSENEFSDNLVGPYTFKFTDISNDASIIADLTEYTEQGCGAFAGTDPYVISGQPAGPMIESIDMPTTVEQGKTMEVTVKIRIRK